MRLRVFTKIAIANYREQKFNHKRENMITKIRFIATIVFTTILVACGGGGGGGGGVVTPVATAQTFNLKTSYANYLQSSSSKNISIAGTTSGINVTGTGTVTTGSLQTSTFQGSNALLKTTSVTSTISGNGKTVPFGFSVQSYYDSNYNYLGFSGAYFLVVNSFSVLPTAAKINDTGTLVSLSSYPSSQFTTFANGTTTITYSLTADTETSAIFTLINVKKDTFGAIISTDTERLRITTTNAVTPLSESFFSSDGTMTVTYQ